MTKPKPKPIRLPTGFRLMVETRAANPISVTDERRERAIAKVCDRAQKLSDADKLIGETADEIAERIYGSVWLWLTLWRYRAVIWWAIRLIASIANGKQNDEKAAEALFAEVPPAADSVRAVSFTVNRNAAEGVRWVDCGSLDDMLDPPGTESEAFRDGSR